MSIFTDSPTPRTGRRREILFVQGGGPDVHDSWDHLLAASLERELGERSVVHYPRMPDEDEPRYSTWSAELLAAVEGLDPRPILVGHSVGATILLHSIAEHRLGWRFGGLFLVAAPFVGDGGWPSDEIATSPERLQRVSEGGPVFLYHGDRDQVVPLAHLRLWARSMPDAVIRVLAGRDHQLGNDLSEVAEDIQGLRDFE